MVTESRIAAWKKAIGWAQPWHTQGTEVFRSMAMAIAVAAPWQQEIRDGLDVDPISHVMSHSLWKRDVVRLAGIEPTTLGFGGRYSIH